jgi:hypothetical protein
MHKDIHVELGAMIVVKATHIRDEWGKNCILMCINASVDSNEEFSVNSNEPRDTKLQGPCAFSGHSNDTLSRTAPMGFVLSRLLLVRFRDGYQIYE